MHVMMLLRLTLLVKKDHSFVTASLIHKIIKILAWPGSAWSQGRAVSVSLETGVRELPPLIWTQSGQGKVLKVSFEKVLQNNSMVMKRRVPGASLVVVTFVRDSVRPLENEWLD